MSPHAKQLRYFKSHPFPEDWSISEYLNYRHRPVPAPRRLLDGWKKSLLLIANCTTPSCCSLEQRERAQDLLRRYEEKGKGSDRQYGKSWLAQKTSKTATAPPPINIGVMYQGSSVTGCQTTINHEPPPQTTNKPSEDTTSIYSDNDLDTINDSDLDFKDSESEEDEGEGTPTPSGGLSEDLSPAQIAFADRYKGMDRASQWVLRSGRTVESIIHKACLALDADSFANSLLQSFVIDTSNEDTKKLFTDPEWEEIQSLILPLPKSDRVLLDSLKRFFKVKSTSDLRDMLRKTDYLPEGVAFDQNIHFNSEWADVVIRMMLIQFEAPGEPLRASHLEDWYSSYLWSPIFDHCLLDLPGMTVERKESTCRATGIRKNRLRTKIGRGNRLKIGRRLDAIIRTVEDDPYEYGAMEVARTFNGVTSSKWLGDFFKLAKALRDMLFRLHGLVDHDEAVVKKLQVVGVFNAGLSFQLIRMSHPKGFVCLLNAEKMQQVPNSVQELVKLFKVLMNVALMKQIIKDCRAAVDEYHNKTEEDVYNELLGETESSKMKLGWAADTP
ncbi:uncharacterized protein H6S33_005890 [Morchella sextelata]|uniref:uncharacterized protein n=1 Tax=Morchella sextelata TaxID=1174677 RepID=UPI001D043D9E|nr:uncharacterized protein H6S33_005890 [Morchella sextelata]KAH0614004.1 hypothetical protein H6S33_005890 [Morchella sextelata]